MMAENSRSGRELIECWAGLGSSQAGPVKVGEDLG